MGAITDLYHEIINDLSSLPSYVLMPNFCSSQNSFKEPLAPGENFPYFTLVIQKWVKLFLTFTKCTVWKYFLEDQIFLSDITRYGKQSWLMAIRQKTHLTDWKNINYVNLTVEWCQTKIKLIQNDWSNSPCFEFSNQLEILDLRAILGKRDDSEFYSVFGQFSRS